MINYFHCPECCISSEIRTESDEIMEEPQFCPFCGYWEIPDEDEYDEEEDTSSDYY